MIFMIYLFELFYDLSVMIFRIYPLGFSFGAYK